MPAQFAPKKCDYCYASIIPTRNCHCCCLWYNYYCTLTLLCSIRPFCDTRLNDLAAQFSILYTMQLLHQLMLVCPHAWRQVLEDLYFFTLQFSELTPTKAVLARAVEKGLLDSACLGEEFVTPQIPKKRNTRQSRINALHLGIPLTPSMAPSSSKRFSKK